jgi:hypothetical protein
MFHSKAKSYASISKAMINPTLLSREKLKSSRCVSMRSEDLKVLITTIRIT